MTALDKLPTVVIGAGPTGLAAAAHLSTRGMSYIVLEATDGVAACFRSTAHVRLFSPWKMNVDPAAARVLEQHGWRAPDPDAMPTAGEMRSQYLEPLARALASHIRYGARVQGVSRRGFDKVKSGARELAPFVIRVRTPSGEEQIEARAVIDASGTWATPNWMGGNGLPALGEEAASAHIQYGMPDVLGSARARYAGKRVMVVGSGHSAIGSLVALSQLASSQAQTSIVWAIRSDNLDKLFGGGSKDGLPERGKLGDTLRHLIDTGELEVVRSFRIEAVRRKLDQLEISGTDKNGSQRIIAAVDEVIVATGARPDLSLARELRLKLDAWLESTEQLAPLIDPNLHSCGSVPPHGHRELTHPEPGYYAIGAKSYGRAPNFLLATGYEQARSVVAALAGDMAAADDVQLVLPETGVCSTDFAEPAATGCCPAPSRPAAASGCCPPASKPAAKSACC
jgi:cation diffusion facilitator CzcD-associated flavoprotein CzcO